MANQPSLSSVQLDALDGSTDASIVLMRAKVVAARICDDVALGWINDEVEGYSSTERLPAYRRIGGTLMIQNPINLEWQPVRFGSTDPSFSDDALREGLSTCLVADSIPYVEGLLRSIDRVGGSIEYRLTEHQRNYLQRMLTVPTGISPGAIRFGMFVDPSVFRHIVTASRRRVLDWTLEHERQQKTNSEYSESRRPDVILYDVFISHAHEDKESFVEPLAHALQDAGISVWYDRFVLQLGDSLSGKIDEGLRDSRYGIVILSKSFFRKRWPEAEYRAMLARQNVDGTKRVLPVWHGVSWREVYEYSPLLADTVAVQASSGVHTVVSQVLAVLRGEPKAALLRSPSGLLNQRVSEALTPDSVKELYQAQVPRMRDEFSARLAEIKRVCTREERLFKYDGYLREVKNAAIQEMRRRNRSAMEAVQRLIESGWEPSFDGRVRSVFVDCFNNFPSPEHDSFSDLWESFSRASREIAQTPSEDAFGSFRRDLGRVQVTAANEAIAILKTHPRSI